MSQANQAEYAMELKLRALQRGKAQRRWRRSWGFDASGCTLGKIATRSWVRPHCGGGAGSGWQRESGLRSWNARWGGKSWNWICSPKPCSASEWAGSDLHVDRGAGRARRPHAGTNVRIEWGKPRQILSATAGLGAAAGGYGIARSGAASWWVALPAYETWGRLSKIPPTPQGDR